MDNFTSKEAKLCDDILAKIREIRDVQNIFPDKTLVIASEYDDDEANAINKRVTILREQAYREGVIAAIRAVALIRSEYTE